MSNYIEIYLFRIMMRKFGSTKKGRKMNTIITEHIHELSSVCQKYEVNYLYVFGSVLTSKFNDESDLDFLVEFNEPKDPVVFGLLLINFEKELANLFSKEVDVVVNRYVNNPFFQKKIDDTKILLYDRRSKKIPA